MEVLPLCRDAVGLFYNPGRLGYSLWVESYTSAEMQPIEQDEKWTGNQSYLFFEWKLFFDIRISSTGYFINSAIVITRYLSLHFDWAIIYFCLNLYLSIPLASVGKYLHCDIVQCIFLDSFYHGELTICYIFLSFFLSFLAVTSPFSK